MDCNVIKDLIPLYIDGCCSPESADLVRAHIDGCEECRSLWETMKQGPETAPSEPAAPKRMGRIREWKASVLQSALLFAHAMNSIINMFYAGIGKAKWALLMSTARQGYLFIPLVFILPPLFGTYGVASVQAAADLISLAISIPLMLKAYRMIKEAAEVG